MISNIYLTFDGNCEEAFNFYKSVFGGEFITFSKFSDIPETDGYKVIEEEKNRIMHVSLKISDNLNIMGSDTSKMAHKLIVGNNFSINLSTTEELKGEKIFNFLSYNGKVTMPLEKTFWAKKFGMITDKFGINWMINID